MLKVGLLCGVIAAMSVSGVNSLKQKSFESKPIDAKLIIELEDDIDTISTEKAIKQQNTVFEKIKHSVNKNAIQSDNLTLLNNAVVVSANKEDVEAIKAIPGVKYVTVNGQHIVKKTRGEMISLDLKKREGEIQGEEENVSATTMNKPSGTAEGEGTLIAVLDNEFYLRGEHVEDGVTYPAYNHETFSPLPSGTKERLSYLNVKNNLTKTNAYKEAVKNGGMVNGAGKEGSFYFNNKVPFYYDYAGDTYNRVTVDVPSDFNVESTVDLHGSHVASIAAGNAETYKGIAPKAQLVLMKVFTDVHKTPVSEAGNLGEYGSFSELAFIKALEDCITIGVDAINVSIGSDLSDFEKGTISQRTLQKISDAGILSAIAAGNGGKMSYAFTGGYANWTKDIVETGVMGSFANNASTMTVAAGQPTKTFYADSFDLDGAVVPYLDQIVNREGQAATYPDNEHRFLELINGGVIDPDEEGFEPTAEEQEIELDYVYVKGFGEEKDYKNLDVSGKIVVLNRGKINFSEKYETADNHGAKALVIINNDPTEQDFTFTCDFGDSAKSIGFPIALALFKDKPMFEAKPQGKLKIKRNTASENVLSRTISDFSTDGATYDLDLKPEITTPGSNIKGAVWPQNKQEKKTPYSAYEYLNGTSMAAPNFEGAMALVLSKTTSELNLSDKNASKAIAEARKTIDMKMMSTAIPMHDSKANDENNEVSLTSPRMQGAGLVNLEGAYNTDVYLEGMDIDGTRLNKAKILLRNSDDVSKGKISLSFIGHNESSTARTYNVKYNVMRPAVAYSNKVLTSDYGTPVEVDSVKSIPGFVFYSPEEEKIIEADGTANYKDVIKVSKDIEYFENESQYLAEDPQGVLKEGLYYCDNTSGKYVWKEVPNSEYQSIKDIEIASVDCGQVTLKANGETAVSLKSYELTKEQKDKIAELYKGGTYLEGYVSLESIDGYIDLSIPYMGFYSLSDRIDGASYSSAPVVEPFSFEKEENTIYGSDLINDIAKSLLGKDNADMGSLMVAGYAKNLQNVNMNGVITNDNNIKNFAGFHEVATVPDPYSSDLSDNPKENIYLGNPSKTNTLIVQQFVYRSVKDNYFTITNKANGNEVYRNALEDSLFGDTAGKYALYKSHVDADYLGAGYIAHRALALIPLYDIKTKEAFPSGEYELKFNYQLASTGAWVSKAYTLHIDSESPVIETIEQFSQNGKEMIRLTYKETKCAYAIVGSTMVDVKYDSSRKMYVSEFEKSIMDAAASSSAKTSFSDSRVFIKVVDYARGETTAICHFNGSYSDFEIAQGSEFTINDDFKFENDKVTYIRVDENGEEKEFTTMYDVTVTTGKEKSKASSMKKSLLVVIAEFFMNIFGNLFSWLKF